MGSLRSLCTPQECTNIFSSGGGQSLADYAGLKLLATIPIEPKLGQCSDDGLDFIHNFSESVTAQTFTALAKNLFLDSDE